MQTVRLTPIRGEWYCLSFW